MDENEDDEPLPPEFETSLLRAFEDHALQDFPNPTRTGCPGTGFLWTLAANRRTVSALDPRVDHVVSCSPCFRELTAFRRRFLPG